MEKQRHNRPMRGPGAGFVPGEKAKNFKGTIKSLFHYIGAYHLALVLVALFAISSTVFNIFGPKILGNATTELSSGLMVQIAGTGSIDFSAIAKILLTALGLYVISA